MHITTSYVLIIYLLQYRQQFRASYGVGGLEIATIGEGHEFCFYATED